MKEKRQKYLSLLTLAFILVQLVLSRSGVMMNVNAEASNEGVEKNNIQVSDEKNEQELISSTFDNSSLRLNKDELKVGDTLEVKLEGVEENNLISYISLDYSNEEIHSTARGIYSEDENSYLFSIEITDKISAGRWFIENIKAYDENDNLVLQTNGSDLFFDVLESINIDSIDSEDIETNNLSTNENHFQGEGTDASPFKISSSDDLYALSALVNTEGSYYADKHYILTDNIDLSEGGDWIPIGLDSGKAFKGVFNGQNYTISNMTINSPLTDDNRVYLGLFGYINDGEVIDLSISDFSISSDYSFWGYINSGALAGYNSGELTNIRTKGGSFNHKAIQSDRIRIGGIVATNYGKIINSANYTNFELSNSENVFAASLEISGIANTNHGTIKNSFNYGDFDVNSRISVTIGGISSFTGRDSVIEKTGNYGNIDLRVNVNAGSAGGIANSGQGIIRSSYNVGEVDVYASHSQLRAGGIAGSFTGLIEQSYNTGSVRGITTGTSIEPHIGGLVGDFRSNGSIENSYNTGDVYGESSDTFFNRTAYTGGIAGYKYQAEIENVYNIGRVSTNAYEENNKVGSIAGLNNFGTISNAYYLDEGVDGIAEGSHLEGTTALSKAEFEKESSFQGFDFDNLWAFKGNAIKRPVLRNLDEQFIGLKWEYYPDNTTYYYGTDFDPSGGVLLYGTSEGINRIELTAELVDGFDSKKLGEQTVTVSYQQKQLSLDLYITDYVDKVEMHQLPNKLTYLKGETLDLSGGKIGVTRASEREVTYIYDLNEVSVSGYDKNTLGKQIIDVEFEGKSTSFSVVVNRFTDVVFGQRGFDIVNRLAETGIINGYQDGTFKPNNNITRAQAAVMIVRAANIDIDGKTSDFDDVPHSHSAYRFISAAYDAGIIRGYSIDNTYRPNEFITRGQIAVMLTRAFELEKTDNEGLEFVDVSESNPQSQFIDILSSQGIINGYQDGTFRPNNNTTRVQFSTMLDRLIN